MKLLEITEQIVDFSTPILNEYIEDDSFELFLDYVTIYPSSLADEKDMLDNLKRLGKKVWPDDTGNVYLLNNPLQTINGSLCLLKVCRYKHIKKNMIGYIDYYVEKSKYKEFKENLIRKPNTTLEITPDYEILGIVDNKYNIAVYFPSIPLTEDVQKLL